VHGGTEDGNYVGRGMTHLPVAAPHEIDDLQARTGVRHDEAYLLPYVYRVLPMRAEKIVSRISSLLAIWEG